MITQPQTLIEVFATISDFRRSRGKRHPLPAMLSLACCAVLCGYRSYNANGYARAIRGRVPK